MRYLDMSCGGETVDNNVVQAISRKSILIIMILIGFRIRFIGMQTPEWDRDRIKCPPVRPSVCWGQ